MEKYITKRELRGRELANLTKSVIKGIPKSGREMYRLKLIRILSNHKFQKRKETDPLHPNTGKRYTINDVADTRTPQGLAQIIINNLEGYCNADATNKIKKYLLGNIR